MKSSVIYLVTAFAIAFAVLLVVPLWYALGAIGAEGHGGHAVGQIMTRDIFERQLKKQQEKYGLPDGSVRITDGGDVYIMAQQFAFLPRVIRLQTGKMYHLNFYSPDVLHGVSLVQVESLGLLRTHSLNNVLPPGPITTIMLTPHLPGEVLIVCNEYCGPGHHLMASKILVEGEPFSMEMLPWYQRIKMLKMPVSHWIYHDLLNRQAAAVEPKLIYNPLPQRTGFFMAPHPGWEYWHFHGLQAEEKEFFHAADLADGKEDGKIAPGTPGVPEEFIRHFNMPAEKTKLFRER